jgi:hypothetical protein
VKVSTILRVGAALCFIGHGAFGIITKAAWLPYFAVAGIPESTAWQLMPIIGAVDILAGIIVLIAPRRLPLLYMIAWGTWTALLRPLAGESVFETIERAGNFGVPLALLLLMLQRNDSVREVLKWTTVLLLAGHGALGITGKALLTANYAAIGLPSSTTALVGWLELALAAWIALRPGVGVLLFVAAWKVATESLFVVAGHAFGPAIWELVERAGSYAAPLALAVLLARTSPRSRSWFGIRPPYSFRRSVSQSPSSAADPRS